MIEVLNGYAGVLLLPGITLQGAANPGNSRIRGRGRNRDKP